jgi:hypothetical protein
MACLDSGEVAEWLKAPHSKFGGGDNLGCYRVPTCLNKLTIFKHRSLSDDVLSCFVLSSSVAKW